jgi:hypothetical protein
MGSQPQILGAQPHHVCDERARLIAANQSLITGHSSAFASGFLKKQVRLCRSVDDEDD